MNATWKQAKKIWGFCEIYGNKNTDWAKLAKEGRLTADKASTIVAYVFEKKHSSAELCIQEFITDFKLSNTKDTKPPKREEREEGQQEGAGGSKGKGGSYKVPPPQEGTGIPGLDEIIKQKEILEHEEKRLREQNEEDKKREKEEQKLKEKHDKELKEQKKKDEERLAKEQETKEELAKEENRKPPEIKVKTKGYYKPKIFDAVYACVRAGLQVFLSGPAGCGKSRLASEISKALDADFFVMSMTGGMRYAQVFGGTQITDGKTEWIPGELLQQIQKPGLVLIDEILSADPEVVLGLNGPLEKSMRAIQTPIGKIKVHDKCVFIAAANTVGRQVSRQYTGAQRHDDSLLDRFITFRMDYDPDVETLLVGEAQLALSTAGYILTNLKALRMKIKEHNIPFDASTRRMLTAITAYKAGLSMKSAFNQAFLETLSPSEQRKVQEG